MFNLSFSPPPVSTQRVVSGFKNYTSKTDSSGRSSLVECFDPYEGLIAESFSLQAQIEAGVPLKHVEGYKSTSLSGIDTNNANAEKFVEKLNQPKKD